MTTTNRLELFRDRIAAFDGAADPIRAISQGYIIEEPNQSSTNTLFKRISLRPQSKILLIGGIGSGKTTQLLRLQQLFQENSESDIYPYYIDVTRYTKPNDIQIGTLNAIIGLELITLLEKNRFDVDGMEKKAIQNFAYGYSVTKRDPKSTGTAVFDNRIIEEIPGVLSLNPHSASSLNQCNKILTTLLERFNFNFKKTLYLLLDGLDRVDEIGKFIQISSLDIQLLDIGIIVVGATSLLYSNFIESIDSLFTHFEYRVAFDVNRDESSRVFFRQVSIARSSINFFQEDALEELITLSGGVLRDLISLAQESIQEAYLDDAEAVNIEHVTISARSMGRAKLLGLDEKKINILKNLIDSKLDVPTSTDEIYLLASGRILEYRHPDRRFDIHPVLRWILS